MSQAIIRGVWGHGVGHSDDDIFKTVHEAKQNQDVVDKVYCFGTENRIRLKQLGYKPDMLDSEPIASPRINATERRHGYNHPHRWGVSYWWHKFKILEAATQEFDHVLWQDFDVRMQQPLPDGFWDELKSGADIRASLVVQHSGSRGAWWRIPYEDKHRKRFCLNREQPPSVQICTYQQARVVPAGGYLYVRGTEVVEQLMALQNKHMSWNNQPILSLLIDQRYNGWQGIQSYIDNGHEVEGYFYGASINRPALRQTIWCCGSRTIQRDAEQTDWCWEKW